MLYIIAYAGSEWGKVGVTESYLWTRFQSLWTNIHPPALCCKLGCEHIEVLRVFRGNRAEEQALFSLFPPDHGEFYLASRLPQIIALAELMFDSLPAPDKPSVFDPPKEKRPCCGGVQFTCSVCKKTFQRACKFRQHMDDVHRKIRVKCSCGKEIPSRNLVRHQSSKACNAYKGSEVKL